MSSKPTNKSFWPSDFVYSSFTKSMSLLEFQYRDVEPSPVLRNTHATSVLSQATGRLVAAAPLATTIAISGNVHSANSSEIPSHHPKNMACGIIGTKTNVTTPRSFIPAHNPRANRYRIDKAATNAERPAITTIGTGS